jgi:CO/xanthine dehydrogenase FAD-binding subunit
MDLNTVTEIATPGVRAAIPAFRPGDAYLAGGTWLFSEPQTSLRRLIDLTTLGWPPIEQTPHGLTIAATCTLAMLDAYEPNPAWPAAALIRQCCRALLGSFKIRKAATFGGNLCLALPAAPMAALAVALEGICTIWSQDGGERMLPAASLITGAQTTALRDGDILRAVTFPASALRRRGAFRQMSLTPLGRSAALLIGTSDAARFDLTITASVARPQRLTFPSPPSPSERATAIDANIPVWFDDIHGRPAWRRRITHVLAAEIQADLCPQ